jgi:hypothetical protein
MISTNKWSPYIIYYRVRSSFFLVERKLSYIYCEIIQPSEKLNKNTEQRKLKIEDRRNRNVSCNTLLRIKIDLLFRIDRGIILHL